MGKPLRLILVEDSDADEQLLLRFLQDAGYSVSHTRVQTADEMKSALELDSWDLVISDYHLPAFSALSVLAILKQRIVKLPVIVVSGTIGEEAAVEVMRAGAHDFITKDNLSRLVPAVERELIQSTLGRERHQAEQALIDTQERLQRAVSAGNVGLWDWDLETNEVFYSPEWKRHIGYEDHEIGTGLDEWKDRVHPDDIERVVGKLNACLADPALKYTVEFRFEHKDGSYRWILAQGSLVIENGKTTRMIGSHVDITDRKTLEAQFLQAQKLEGIGRLAGGVAHDFNNLLNVIIGYSEYALRSIPETEELYTDIWHVRDAARKAADLTRQLLAFSRKQLLQPAVLNLNQIVAASEKMLRRVIGEDIEFMTSLAPDLGNTRVDPVQIEQVMMNLVINARDAIPEVGGITIETANMEVSESFVRDHAGLKPGSYVRLTISDTGVGMNQDTLTKIFEPFFTTKPQGKGTGLGLSTVFGIVKQSGGYVDVQSEVGVGSSFSIYLPRVEETTQERTDDLPNRLSSGDETVLVVEDDAAVRTLAARVLSGAGYFVLTASNGDEALSIVERHAYPIDLVLTDVIMPFMGGQTLAERLLASRPGIRVVFMSGYTENALLQRGMLAGEVEFLSKPFDVNQLASKVRDVLDKAPSGS